MGVHFIAGLRMIVGCEVTSVSAITSHIDRTLPPPDVISSNFKLENGCSGVFVMVVSSSSPKIIWRVVGSKGTVQVERGKVDGKHGYLVSLYSADGQCKSTFHPFCGVHEELKIFIHDIVQANLKQFNTDSHISLHVLVISLSQNSSDTIFGLGEAKQGNGYEAEPRSSFVEGARDVAVLEAMLESGSKGGTLVNGFKRVNHSPLGGRLYCIEEVCTFSSVTACECPQWGMNEVLEESPWSSLLETWALRNNVANLTRST
ncbi:hypothetical protein Goarm_023359, partial [Gossypium armourianum]|nr:hypothetical protein [Gossypium armourianum]